MTRLDALMLMLAALIAVGVTAPCAYLWWRLGWEEEG